MKIDLAFDYQSILRNNRVAPKNTILSLKMKTKCYRVKFRAPGINGLITTEVVADLTLQVKRIIGTLYKGAYNFKISAPLYR